MIAVGFRLQFRIPPAHRVPLAAGLVMKLVLAPLIALGGCHLLGLDGEAVSVSIFEAGMPPMVAAWALASRAGLHPDLGAAMGSVTVRGNSEKRVDSGSLIQRTDEQMRKCQTRPKKRISTREDLKGDIALSLFSGTLPMSPLAFLDLGGTKNPSREGFTQTNNHRSVIRADSQRVR